MATMPPKAAPLARSVGPDVLDWDGVEADRAPAAQDVLALSAADRAALGLSAPRPHDYALFPAGDAQDALREVLLHGGAVSKKRRG